MSINKDDVGINVANCFIKPESITYVINKSSKEELLKAFNSGETVDDGLEEVFRLGQRHFLAK